MRTIAPSELIINGDGSIFHLHLKPGQLADTVILVGDPRTGRAGRRILRLGGMRVRKTANSLR